MTTPSLLTPVVRTHPRGSPTAIPALPGQRPDGEPWAEPWSGAHHAAPSVLAGRPGSPTLRPGAAAFVPAALPCEASGTAAVLHRARVPSGAAR
ncbi:hypothetical protein ACPF8X_15925 [Streptomyces sp. G35A]